MENLSYIKIIVCALCCAMIAAAAVQSHRSMKTKLKYPLLFEAKEARSMYLQELFGTVVYFTAILLLTFL